MATVGRSAKTFRERSGLIVTRRLPASRTDFSQTALIDYPLAPPLPIPAYLLIGQGHPAPDRAGVSSPWPWPVEN